MIEESTADGRILQHPNVPLSAPAWAWKAAGYEVYSNSDEVRRSSHYGIGDDLLLTSVAGQGLDGAKALAWASTEHQRQKEERTKVTAQAREAEAIGALAEAIKGSSEEATLERILGRLTERTRYAVQAQLR